MTFSLIILQQSTQKLNLIRKIFIKAKNLQFSQTYLGIDYVHKQFAFSGSYDLTSFNPRNKNSLLKCRTTGWPDSEVWLLRVHL